LLVSFASWMEVYYIQLQEQGHPVASVALQVALAVESASSYRPPFLCATQRRINSTVNLQR
jgi:hypothetical protein